MGLRRVTAPASLPVTLEEAKAQFRTDHDDEDALIMRKIGAVTDHLDGYEGILNRCLISQQWELLLDAFPPGSIELPLKPIISIDAITYTDSAGDDQIIAADSYEADTTSSSAWVVPIVPWPPTLTAINVVRILFTAGYGPNPEDVPGDIRDAILAHVGHLYEHRESVSNTQTYPVAETVMHLVTKHRRISF